MTDSTDPRALRTRAKLIDAYFELASANPAGEVTIAALTQAAGVHRSVFYKHFATPDDLAIHMLSDLFGMLSNADVIMRSDFASTGHDASLAAMTEFVRFVAARRPVYATLLGPGAPAGALQATIDEFAHRTALALEQMTDRPAHADPRIVARFLAHGVIGVIGHWLTESPQARTEAQIVEQLMQCFPGWLTSSSSPPPPAPRPR